MDILLFALIFPRPFGARKNTTQLAKHPRVLYVKPYKKVYFFSIHLLGLLHHCGLFVHRSSSRRSVSLWHLLRRFLHYHAYGYKQCKKCYNETTKNLVCSVVPRPHLHYASERPDEAWNGISNSQGTTGNEVKRSQGRHHRKNDTGNENHRLTSLYLCCHNTPI